MADEGTKTARAPKEEPRRTRHDREAEVRRKYDFSVIRSLRQAKGLTIERFAKLCGLSYAPISRIETNLIKPNLDTLDKIANGLGLTTYNLVAMAERRDAEKKRGSEYQAGEFRFTTFTFDKVDVSYGVGRKGATADHLDIRDRDCEHIVVQAGLLEVTVQGESFQLAAGESLQCDRIYKRHYRALEDTSLVIVATSDS